MPASPGSTSRFRRIETIVPPVLPGTLHLDSTPNLQRILYIAFGSCTPDTDLDIFDIFVKLPIDNTALRTVPHKTSRRL